MSESRSYSSEWDKKQKEGLKGLQEQLDVHTYGVQRGQRGNMLFHSLLYPTFYQRDLLNIAILNKKKWLGQITQQEVDLFKAFNPKIAYSYNQAFHYNFPIYGFGIGCVLLSGCHLMNVGYSFRISALLMPMAYNVLYNKYNGKNRQSNEFQSLELMDWVIEYRKQKAIHQKNLPLFNQNLLQQTKQQMPNVNVTHAIEQMANLNQ